MMAVRNQGSFPVITVPKLMRQNLEKRRKKEEKFHAAKRLETIRERSRIGNRSVSIH